MARLQANARRNVTHWLRGGISPRRLALTFALGFAVGCIPVVGIPTVLCVALALTLRLNLPAIQAANYAAMPLQLVLIVPFVRLGGWLVAALPAHTAAQPPMPPIATHSLLHLPVLSAAAWVGGLAGQALLAWLLVAAPAVALMTLALTRMLRRIPALGAAGD